MTENECFDFSLFRSPNFKNLRILNIAANKISSISLNFELPNLEFLNVSCNCIRSFTFISNCRKLQEIFAGTNCFKSLKGLISLKELSLLDLSYNRVENFDDLGILSFNPKLSRLDLKGNPIELKREIKGSLKKLFPGIKDEGFPLMKCSKFFKYEEIAFGRKGSNEENKYKFCVSNLS